MASNGAADGFSTPNVLQAMLTMRSGDSGSKKAAMDYLQKFQKSVSWDFSSFDINTPMIRM